MLTELGPLSDVTLQAACLSELGRAEESLQILDDTDDDPAVKYQRAIAYTRLEQYEAAANELAIALRRSPNNWLCRKLQVGCLIEIACHQEHGTKQDVEFQTAIEAAEAVLAQSPEAVEIWVQKSRAHLHRGELGEAETAARRALQLDPRFPPGHFFLGFVLCQQGNADAAASAFQMAADLHSLHAGRQTALACLASILLAKERFEEVADTCVRARNFGGPHIQDAYLDWLQGRALVGANRDLEQAAELLENAEQHFPNRPGLLATLGNAYLLRHKPREAKYNYERALRLDGNCLAALVGRIQVALLEWQGKRVVPHEIPIIKGLGGRLRALASDHPVVLETLESLDLLGGLIEIDARIRVIT